MGKGKIMLSARNRTEAVEEVVFRGFRPDDLDGLFMLDQRSYPPACRLRYPQLRALLLDADTATLVAEGRDAEGPLVIGALMVRTEAAASRLVVLSLMVDEDFQRLGLGRRLMGWAQAACRGRGLRQVIVPLEREIAAGEPFLRALGFQPAEDGAPFFDDPQAGRLWTLAVDSGETP
jgi:ribosomal protein S18 acetylase RimI-like enzyme